MARWDRDGVLARTDLRALLDEVSGPAVGSGPSARWRCPDPNHDDYHPSVTVTEDRRGIEKWRCWSGGHGGGAIDLVISAYRVGFEEAVSELGRRAGVRPEEPHLRSVRPPLQPREPVPLHPHVRRYVEICEEMLWKPMGRPVLDYLTSERGLDPEVLRANRVGADPGSKLRKPLGLPRGGIGAVLPALDADRSIVYAQTRYLSPHEERSKYDNPARRLGDNPRHGWTRPVGQWAEPVVVCEGLIDAYTVNAAGYEAVAVLGALNATPELARTIAARLGTRPAIVAFDGDDPGRRAAAVVSETLRSRGILVGELPLPSGSDLNSWALATRQVPQLASPHRPTVAAAAPPVPIPELTGL